MVPMLVVGRGEGGPEEAARAKQGKAGQGKGKDSWDQDSQARSQIHKLVGRAAAKVPQDRAARVRSAMDDTYVGTYISTEYLGRYNVDSIGVVVPGLVTKYLTHYYCQVRMRWLGTGGCRPFLASTNALPHSWKTANPPRPTDETKHQKPHPGPSLDCPRILIQLSQH